MKLILILLSFISLKTCNSAQKFMNEDPFILNGNFHINSLSDVVITDYKLTIEFNEQTKQVSGFSGCNRFSGTYSLNENTIKIGPLALTRMFCDETKNKIESTLLQNLSKADSIKFENGILYFLSNKKNLLEAVKTEEQIINVSFEYTANSRGVYKHIIINKKNISLENKRDKTPIITACSEANWNSLLKTLKPIDIENIPNLKAPSEKRFYDGAAIANLTINYNGKAYETQSFDHGNPPKEIAELVKDILSISENIE